MFKKLLMLALGWLIAYAAEPVTMVPAVVTMVPADSCIHCICMAESECQPLGCHMDEGSLSCGYFQIKLPYYIDCGKPGQRLGQNVTDAWKECSKDYDCSVKCVNAYYERYKNDCAGLGMGTCEVMARNHNGGPYGCKAGQGTFSYWAKVKNCCQCT